jgi:hypothetical protein
MRRAWSRPHSIVPDCLKTMSPLCLCDARGKCALFLALAPDSFLELIVPHCFIPGAIFPARIRGAQFSTTTSETALTTGLNTLQKSFWNQAQCNR